MYQESHRIKTITLVLILDCRKPAYVSRTTSRDVAASSTYRCIKCWGSWAPARTRSPMADSWSTIRVNWRIGTSVTSVIATRTNVSLLKYVYKASRVEIDIKLKSVSADIPTKKLILLRNVSLFPKAEEIWNIHQFIFTSW